MEQPKLMENEIEHEHEHEIEDDSHFLPPRKQVHPSEKVKVAVIFYRILVALFVLLVIGLTIWGISLLKE
ncbi:hypothetical protein NV379_06600 [Paenibacillus sp. N1-5-1-14]|uniref:hypothetical protein n=1 Tax=Paenibacillus radicibacter TaxID=2972488 RepID=UPI0021592321|nr:hypothetical protein [Paenibacillus radicibacter]MCR8642327.1 hypothetical protein [Paenibacillus radicibacter]